MQHRTKRILGLFTVLAYETRACSHKMNVRIFEHNFGEYKAKNAGELSIGKHFQHSSHQKLPRIRALHFYVNTLKLY